MNSRAGAAMRFYALPILGFMLMAFFRVTQAQTQAQAQAHLDMAAPSPAPLPSNDGAAIDQGIAYILLVLALAITYLVH